MNLEQYIGCVIMYNGRMAIITGARSNYDGDYLYLKYVDSGKDFSVNAFENDLMSALPDPKYGILKRRGEDVLFLFNDTEYTLTSHPYEPCLYIKESGRIVRTLHNAFEADELPERFAQGEVLLGIDGRDYDMKSFCNVLISAISLDRTDMDFTYAAKIARSSVK